MKATIQTHHQVKRFVRKIIDKFPVTDEIILLTDIHIQVNKETGELLAFDDNDSEITRCIIEQWINNNSKDFYSHAIYTLQIALKEMNQHIEQCGILKPFSFVLENEDKEHIEELYLVDDDISIIGEHIMPNISQDLDTFFDNILQETKQ